MGSSVPADDLYDLLTEIRDELRAASGSTRLWKSADVARYLGTSVKSAHNNVFHRNGFPKPKHIPGVGLRWSPGEVKEYVERL